MLKTEIPNPQHQGLDEYATPDLIAAFVEDQIHAVEAVRRVAVDIAAAVDAAVPRIARGGRLVYVGAGTSGRLGVLDSVELYPTFSWPQDRALALLAGGESAMFRSVEGAEDDLEQGARDVEAAQIRADDVVLLISASGTTSYVLGALRAARAAGALTIGLANNPDAPLTCEAEIGIMLDTGPEVISGSTRMKAGTAQKATLNAISSAIMVRLNKTYGNLMVDLQPTNAKLVQRAIRLTAMASGADECAARAMLEACGMQVKMAIVALKRGLSPADAQVLLAKVGGSVRLAIAQ